MAKRIETFMLLSHVPARGAFSRGYTRSASCRRRARFVNRAITRAVAYQHNNRNVPDDGSFRKWIFGAVISASTVTCCT